MQNSTQALDQTITIGNHQININITHDPERGYQASISEDGWAWDGSDTFYATAEEAMAAGVADVQATDFDAD